MEPGTGLLASLSNLAHTLVGAVQTRLQLLAADVEEQGVRLAHMALLWLLAGFCLALAVMLLAVLLVVLFWDTNRVAVLALLAGLFAAGGIAATLGALALARARPKAFSGTLAELEVDREALGAGRQP